MTPDHQQALMNALERQAAHANYQARRFLNQIRFARELATVEPAASKGWEKLIDQAFALVGKVQDLGQIDRLAQAVAQAEALLAPIAKVAKTYTLHCVGHAHIDMNWMWSWPETVTTANDTFLTVLKLMDEFPDFTFSQSQAAIYALIQEHHPELFARIKERIREGRWEVTASHWVEGDHNIASGESLTRHLLYTRRYLAQEMGLSPDDVLVDWSPDTFGHAHTIPAIDARGGVRRYYLCRPGGDPKPPVFWWKSPDGSRVLVNKEIQWYNSHVGPHAASALIELAKATGLKDRLFLYGVGDHGGGPTRRDLRLIQDMNTWPVYPNMLFSTSARYFDILEQHGDKFPTLDQELNFEFTGCYTSQAAIKRNNRYSENLMVETELAAVLGARALGRSYPTECLVKTWQNVLFSHFHDILPGSGVRATRDFNQGDFQRICATAGMIKTNHYRALAAEIDTSFAAEPTATLLPPTHEPLGQGAGIGRNSELGAITSASPVTDGPRPFVFFNPTAFTRTQTVTVTLWDAATGIRPTPIGGKKFVVRFSDGTTIPAQKLDVGQYWSHDFIEVAFPVTVGPLGYTTAAVTEGLVSDFKAPASMQLNVKPSYGEYIPAGCWVMENEHLKVAFNRTHGGIVELLDKATGKNLANPQEPAGLLEYTIERFRDMSAWIIAEPLSTQFPLVPFALDARKQGPYINELCAKYKVGSSTVEVTYALRAQQPWVDITLQVHWFERGTPETGIPHLGIRFPNALTQTSTRYEIPFGSVTRKLNDGREVPGLRWASVEGKLNRSAAAGLTLLNDCKYGHSMRGSTLRLSLIRSSYEPDKLPEIGDHTIRLGLAPHGRVQPVSQLTELGAIFNHPLAIVPCDVHSGSLPAVLQQGLTIKPANVLLSAIKQAEDSQDLIVRLYETDGRATTATVKLDPTLLGKVASAKEVDLLEQPLAKSSAKATPTGFTVRLPAHGITSVKLTMKK